jgi:hypothetical protein
LPKNLVPYHYDLTIKPYFKVDEVPKFYEGLVIINFTCINDTHKLVLNMKNLDISYMLIHSDQDSDFTMIKDISWSLDHETHFFIADFGSKNFKANRNYTFTVKFKGFTENDNIGFYRSSYLDANKNKKYNKNK